MPARSTAAAETFVPEDTAAALAEVSSFLDTHQARHGERPMSRLLLIGDGEGDQVELPEPVYRVLVRAVEALSQGKGITIAPQEPQLTSQQAADLLGVSRPTVIRLIDSGDLHAERIDSRRRLALGEVLAYRERRRAKQYATLEATAVDFHDENDPSEMLELARDARKRAALS